MKKMKWLVLSFLMATTSFFSACFGYEGNTNLNDSWKIGENAPSIDTKADVGTMYLDTTTYDIYQMNQENIWVKIGNIKGEGKTPTIVINEEGYWVINGEETQYKAGELVEAPIPQSLTQQEYNNQVATYGSIYLVRENTRMRIIFSTKMKAGAKVTFKGDASVYKASVCEMQNTANHGLGEGDVDSLWNNDVNSTWTSNGLEYVLTQDCYPVLTVARLNGETALTNDELNKIHSMFEVKGEKTSVNESKDTLTKTEYEAQAAHWGSVNLQTVDTRQRITFAVKMKKGTKVTFLGDTSVYKWAVSEKCDNSLTTTRMLDLGWNTSIASQDTVEYQSYFDGAFLVLTIAKHDNSPLTNDELQNIHDMFKVEGEKFVDYERIPQTQYTVDTVAHRGFSMLAPENTLESYRLAAKLGFTKAECDVCFTADGVPVLLHDGTIDRTSNGSGHIENMTLEEARSYDYGSWMGKEFAGTQIPTFDEFIALCRKINIHPYIELKGAVSAERCQLMVDIVKKYGMLDDVTWISFDYTSLRGVVQADETARVGMTYVNAGDLQTALQLRTGKNEVFVTKEYTSVTDAVVQECLAEGVQILAWTINAPTDVLRLNPYVKEVLSDWVNVGELLYNNELD